MLPNTHSQTHRHFHVVRHIVSYGARGPRHRTTRELTLVRIGGRPCLPDGTRVTLSKRHYQQFQKGCKRDGHLMRFPNAVVSCDATGNWKMTYNLPPIVGGALHLFDIYPLHDLDATEVVANIPTKKLIATAFTSDSSDPVFLPKFGNGACLFAPVRFGFSAGFKLNGATGSEFQVHALTEPTVGKPRAQKKSHQPNSLVVRCGRDALTWLTEAAPAA